MINHLLNKLLSTTRIITAKRCVKSSAAATATAIRRPPVVTIMGHVDHGKTTLLDSLRNSQIVKEEFGGITQHIGAFVVPFKQKNKTELVTFLDTPGHAAFASMRQRGANVTDIVVLVVACEDGVLDQTVESIKYAKASQVPIIVAINKIDKYPNKLELEKNVQLVRKQLTVHDIIPEEDGGEVQLVKISALNGIGIDYLKESILALAETLELKAELDCPASGHVIESSKHEHRGKLCTILVQRGQLIKGDYIVAGKTNWAKVRALFDERNQLRQSCGPGLPIQLTGWREDELPAAGDPFMQVESESEAKKLIHKFKQQRMERKAYEDSKIAREKAEEFQKLYKEKLIEKRASGYRYGRIFLNPKGMIPKESTYDATKDDSKINLVLKCDVDGSLEALLNLLDSYDKDNKQLVKLDVMHYGVGSISENDCILAASFPNAVIYGFNVKLADAKLSLKAKQIGVDLKLFNVIYHLVDDLKARIQSKLPELEENVEIGRANVLQEFVIKETGKRRTRVAGCCCSKGVLKNNCLYRLERNKEVLREGMKVKTLKHLKNDVKEIEKDRECGISFEDVDDLEFMPGDQIIAYEIRMYKPKLKWDLKGF